MAAAPAPDEVELRVGPAIQGIVLRQSDQIVVVLVAGGVRAIPRAEVAEVRASGGSVMGGTASGARGSGAPARVRVIDGPAATGGDAPRRAIADSDRRVDLVVTGKAGGVEIDASDAATRRMLGDFFSRRAEPALELIEPAGGTAGLRVRLDADIRIGDAVSFYGVELGRQAECRLNFRLERVLEDRIEPLVMGVIDGQVLGSEDLAELGRRAYDAALQNLVEQLAALPVFGAKPPASS